MNVIESYQNRISTDSPIHKFLQKVNDYTIYTFFIGKEIQLKEIIRSPLREDDNPTFNIFPPKDPKWPGQLLFKDFNGTSGNVFKFVKLYALYHERIVLTTLNSLMDYISKKMKLGTTSSVRVIYKPVDVKKEEYFIKHAEWDEELYSYWEQYGVSLELLQFYKVYPVKYLLDENKYIIKDFTYTHTYAYWIYDKFKLYQPYKENFKKFFNQCPSEYIQGIEQCLYQTDHLVITKSSKDILTIQAHTPGYWQDCVAPHGEGYKLTDRQMHWVLTNYKKITILFDPDYTGVVGANRFRNQLRNSRFYSGQEIRVDFVSRKRVKKHGKLMAPIKDISDFRLIKTPEQTVEKIKVLLGYE